MRAKRELSVIERRPCYENKEAEQEALGRAAMKFALIGEKYNDKKTKKSTA